MSNQLELTLITQSGEQNRQCDVNRLIVAGWTGRDRDAMEKHIVELEALGITRPASTPIFYRVSASRLIITDSIQIPGNQSSGEVECVYANIDGDIWVGVGSDHTDREVESYGVTVSKQMCDKPIAPRFWPLSELVDHWDSMIIRSCISNGEDDEIYQEGTLSAMLSPQDLFSLYAEQTKSVLQSGDFMFGGTLVAKGGIRPSRHFSFEIEDPILNRTISHAYEIEELPVLG